MKGNHMVDGNKFGSSLVLRAYMDYFYIEIRQKKKTELDAITKVKNLFIISTSKLPWNKSYIFI